jgi:hypothetical protein
MHVLAGFPIDATDFLRPQIDTDHIPTTIATLKGYARGQVNANGGKYYMRVSTTVASGGGHAENIDIARLLDLDLNKMQDGEVYCIGDRNWIEKPFFNVPSFAVERPVDIPRLAVRKRMDRSKNPAVAVYEFGTAYRAESSKHQTIFTKEDIEIFRVYSAEIRQLPNPGEEAEPPVA